MAWTADPELFAWMQRSRLNGAAGISDHRDDPQMQSALARLFANIEPALAKLAKFTAEISPAGGPAPAA